MLIGLFGFTVLAGLLGAIWEWVGVSRLLVREFPEERGGVAYPALKRKVMETHRDLELPSGIGYPKSIS